MAYVDGFVLAVPKKKLAAYRRLARQAGKVWMEHGALEYRECVGDDMKAHMGVPFPALAKAKKGETVVFAWIVYKSRAHRARVMAKVMADKRMAKPPADMPFDMTRMSHGGFTMLVDFSGG
jgi:uncharacterized protein YbaA (DUF1428 family)